MSQKISTFCELLLRDSVVPYNSDFQPVFRRKLVFRERSSGVPQEIW